MDEAKKRWGNLRDYFRRLVKEQGDKRSGDGASKKKQWVFFERLSFLLPFMKGREMTSSLRAIEPQEESNDSQEIHSLPSPTQHTLPSSPSPSQHPLPSPSPSPQPPTPSSSAGSDKKATRLVKRKAPAEDEVAAELLKVVRESDKLDEDEQFFNSCLPMVRTLSGEEKLEFRISVQQLLLQAVRRRSTAARGHGERESQYSSTSRYYQDYMTYASGSQYPDTHDF